MKTVFLVLAILALVGLNFYGGFDLKVSKDKMITSLETQLQEKKDERDKLQNENDEFKTKLAGLRKESERSQEYINTMKKQIDDLLFATEPGKIKESSADESELDGVAEIAPPVKVVVKEASIEEVEVITETEELKPKPVAVKVKPVSVAKVVVKAEIADENEPVVKQEAELVPVVETETETKVSPKVEVAPEPEIKAAPVIEVTPEVNIEPQSEAKGDTI